MALQYRVKRMQMNYKEGKPEGFQAQMVKQPVVREDNLVEYIANSTNLPRSTVLACTMAIADAIKLYVIHGHRVSFKHFGKFHLKVQNTCVDTLEECQADTVKRIQLCFTPNEDIKRVLNKTGLVNYASLNDSNND